MEAVPKMPPALPSSDGKPSPPSPSVERLGKYTEKLLELLVLGLPTLLIQGVCKDVADRFFSQPWHAICFILPLAVVAWIAWQIAKGHNELRLRGPNLVFFGAYVLCFSLATNSSLLDWNRRWTQTGQPIPHSRLASDRIGDWHYGLIPRKPAGDLVIVTTKPPRNVLEARLGISRLIWLAADQKAQGVLLDFLFRVDSPIDPGLCATLKGAGIPVLFTVPVKISHGDVKPDRFATALENCVAGNARGHPIGIASRDQKVRFIEFDRIRNLPPLSLLAAAEISGKSVEEMENAAKPAKGLLQFIAPLAPPGEELEFPQVSFESLQRDDEAGEEARQELQGRFLFVGQEAEWVDTPYGRRNGVWIHAAAAHSLLKGHFIERSPWWVNLGFVFVVCYLLLTRATRGDAVRQLVLFCAAATLAVVALAAVACRALFWIDVIYTVMAVWLLLALALGRRRWSSS